MAINFPNDPATFPGDGGEWTDPQVPSTGTWKVELINGEAVWTLISGSAGAGGSLSGLDDTAITNPTNNQIVAYNATTGKWANVDRESIPTNLGDLTNVTITTPANDEVLVYEGGTWINKANQGVGGVTEAPNDGQQYARQNEGWQVVAGGGGGGGIEEAPNSGATYGRKDSQWVEIGFGEAVLTGDNAINTGDAPGGGDAPAKKEGRSVPLNGQVLAYDDFSEAFVPTTISSGGGGGIAEAPEDSKPYSRQNAGWVESPTGISEAPEDSKSYSRRDAGWVESPSGVEEAPEDSKPYVRQDKTWIELPASGGTLNIDEAPQDGSAYVRKDATWVFGVEGTVKIDGSKDIDTGAAPTTGQALVYNGTKWLPGTVSGGDGGGGTDATIKWDIGATGVASYDFSGPGFPTVVANPLLSVVRGQSYIFNNTSGSHPFQIQSTPTTFGTAYNEGVTNNGTVGEVSWTVPMDAPEDLFYQCLAHEEMNGKIAVVANQDIQLPPTAQDGDMAIWREVAPEEVGKGESRYIVAPLPTITKGDTLSYQGGRSSDINKLGVPTAMGGVDAPLITGTEQTDDGWTIVVNDQASTGNYDDESLDVVLPAYVQSQTYLGYSPVAKPLKVYGNGAMYWIDSGQVPPDNYEDDYSINNQNTSLLFAFHAVDMIIDAVLTKDVVYEDEKYFVVRAQWYDEYGFMMDGTGGDPARSTGKKRTSVKGITRNIVPYWWCELWLGEKGSWRMMQGTPQGGCTYFDETEVVGTNNEFRNGIYKGGVEVDPETGKVGGEGAARNLDAFGMAYNETQTKDGTISQPPGDWYLEYRKVFSPAGEGVLVLDLHDVGLKEEDLINGMSLVWNVERGQWIGAVEDEGDGINGLAGTLYQIRDNDALVFRLNPPENGNSDPAPKVVNRAQMAQNAYHTYHGSKDRDPTSTVFAASLLGIGGENSQEFLCEFPNVAAPRDRLEVYSSLKSDNLSTRTDSERCELNGEVPEFFGTGDAIDVTQVNSPKLVNGGELTVMLMTQAEANNRDQSALFAYSPCAYFNPDGGGGGPAKNVPPSKLGFEIIWRKYASTSEYYYDIDLVEQFDDGQSTRTQGVLSSNNWSLNVGNEGGEDGEFWYKRYMGRGINKKPTHICFQIEEDTEEADGTYIWSLFIDGFLSDQLFGQPDMVFNTDSESEYRPRIGEAGSEDWFVLANSQTFTGYDCFNIYIWNVLMKNKAYWKESDYFAYPTRAAGAPLGSTSTMVYGTDEAPAYDNFSGYDYLDTNYANGIWFRRGSSGLTSTLHKRSDSTEVLMDTYTAADNPYLSFYSQETGISVGHANGISILQQPGFPPILPYQYDEYKKNLTPGYKFPEFGSWTVVAPIEDLSDIPWGNTTIEGQPVERNNNVIMYDASNNRWKSQRGFQPVPGLAIAEYKSRYYGSIPVYSEMRYGANTASNQYLDNDIASQRALPYRDACENRTNPTQFTNGFEGAHGDKGSKVHVYDYCSSEAQFWAATSDSGRYWCSTTESGLNDTLYIMSGDKFDNRVLISTLATNLGGHDLAITTKSFGSGTIGSWTGGWQSFTIKTCEMGRDPNGVIRPDVIKLRLISTQDNGYELNDLGVFHYGTANSYLNTTNAKFLAISVSEIMPKEGEQIAFNGYNRYVAQDAAIDGVPIEMPKTPKHYFKPYLYTNDFETEITSGNDAGLCLTFNSLIITQYDLDEEEFLPDAWMKSDSGSLNLNLLEKVMRIGLESPTGDDYGVYIAIRGNWGSDNDNFSGQPYGPTHQVGPNNIGCYKFDTTGLTDFDTFGLNRLIADWKTLRDAGWVFYIEPIVDKSKIEDYSYLYWDEFAGKWVPEFLNGGGDAPARRKAALLREIEKDPETFRKALGL